MTARKLIAAALYLLLGLYSSHLAMCGAEFLGHAGEELVHVKSDIDAQGAELLVRDDRGVKQALSVIAAPDAATTMASAMTVAAMLVLATVFVFWFPVQRHLFATARGGQPVGRWHRTVVLLI